MPIKDLEKRRAYCHRKYVRGLKPIVKVCVICGASFLAKLTAQQIKNGLVNTCSKICRGLKISKSGDKKIERTCETCDKIFKIQLNRESTARFCSTACYGVSLRKSRIGDKNPAWNGGVTPVNLSIRKSINYAEWRKRVFERDGYACVECGKGNRNGERTTLQADHIKTFSEHPELRFSVDNGRTLCVPCHRNTPTWGGKGRFEKGPIQQERMRILWTERKNIIKVKSNVDA